MQKKMNLYSNLFCKAVDNFESIELNVAVLEPIGDNHDYKQGLTLKARLYVMLGSMLLGLILLGGYSVLDLRSHILDEKKLALQALVDSGMGVIQEQYDLFKAGKLTEQEAQRLAKDNLRKSKYHNGADYFFIYDFNGVNLMHASKPEREGQNLLDAKDPNGKYYIKEWIDLLKKDGSAHIDYMFPKAGPRIRSPRCLMPKFSSRGDGGWERACTSRTSMPTFGMPQLKSIIFLVR